MRLYKSWHFEVFHFRQDRTYELVLDTEEIDLIQ